MTKDKTLDVLPDRLQAMADEDAELAERSRRMREQARAKESKPCGCVLA